MASPRPVIRWSQPDTSPEDYGALRDCFDSNWISQGPKVQEFERQVADFAGRSHCVAVNSGSSALLAVLLALGVKGGCEVVIPAMSFIAVPFSVSMLGAAPVLADLDRATGMVTAETVRPCLSKATRAVIAIDYSGFANDWAGVAGLCEEYRIPFIVDAASSFLAYCGGRPAGSFGLAATYSFHAAKPLTTGEGGAVVTDDEEFAARLRQVRGHGESPREKYLHTALGGNFRMTDMAASLGLSQLDRRDQIVAARRGAIAHYLNHANLRASALGLYADARFEPNGFTFTILCRDRARLRRELREQGVETRVMWPHCVDEHPPYRSLPLRAAGRVEAAREFAGSALSLPVHKGVGEEEACHVARALRRSSAAV